MLGFVVESGDEAPRFLPFAASQPGEGAIAVASALMLLDDVGFYRKRGVSFRSLLGTRVEQESIPAGTLIDMHVDTTRRRHRARGRARRPAASRRRRSSAHRSPLRRRHQPPDRWWHFALALRARDNWAQLAKFCVVGAVGYAINLAVYAAVLHAGLHYLVAATLSFLVAVTSNYTWNRLWTFRDRARGVAAQGMRFFVVSLGSLGANLLVLDVLISLGAGKLVGQAIAIVLVTPLNFIGNKLWSFRRARVACRRWRAVSSPS